MTALPYVLTGPIGTRASLGLIVLQADEVIEQDFRRLFSDPEVAVHVSRIPSGADLTPETLREMEETLPRAAELLPPSVGFDAIGYACTSGATVIGPKRVEDLIHRSADARAVTDPLTAATEALRHLGARRIGLISPYIEDVSAALRTALTARGFVITRFASFEEQVEARVARIDPNSIRDAGVAMGRHADVDAVFLSCTNLRAMDVIADIEAATGTPSVSSNLALGWHMGRLAGAPAIGPGRLLGA
jgi:maleate isomerase